MAEFPLEPELAKMVVTSHEYRYVLRPAPFVQRLQGLCSVSFAGQGLHAS